MSTVFAVFAVFAAFTLSALEWANAAFSASSFGVFTGPPALSELVPSAVEGRSESNGERADETGLDYFTPSDGPNSPYVS